GRWRELLPRPVAAGDLGGQPYRVDAVLAGCPPAVNGRASKGFATAASAISVLHEATAASVVADRALVERWVDVHVTELAQRAPRRAGVAVRLERLREELHAALIGRTFRVGWIHGDYWLGNLLFDEAEGTSPRPTGIVDWETAAPLEHPIHDVLHLLLYTRRLE